MHPVTLAAIAVLLINDYVFKQAWPGSWWTGKLSDLAWMVFAPPVLATVIALFVPRAPVWRHVVFAIAYGGLALLYLTYNLVEPLHDAIMSGFALLSSATHTSPFDPTDAFVIPPAIAVTTWVWNRSRATHIQRNAAFAAVAIAMFASVATSRDDAPIGITDISEHQGTLTALSCMEYGRVVGAYTSLDRGRTWITTAVPDDTRCKFVAAPLSERVAPPEMETLLDYRVQALTQRQAGTWLPPQALLSGPYDWVDLPETGEVVVAMGVYGVVVTAEVDSWEWVAVGPFQVVSRQVV
ncbi:MAG: hypothetical protein O2884_14440 [Chloroflexi bacterium]|nr:hypothetical protein [Chloroflexota bacterium]